MESYYQSTPLIGRLLLEIGKQLGIVDATHLRKPRTELRRRNRIQTIRASLAIEGNSLDEEQITALLDKRPVVGPAKDILEVENAIRVYGKLEDLDPFSESSYLEAHRLLMTGLVDRPGNYRSGNVGILQGSRLAHLAPPAWNVPHLMRTLFRWLNESQESLLVKSCVFHYEMEFIHPFLDGNGRMGRLWQTVILIRENPVFAYLPVEKAIKQEQEAYYNALAESDREGQCTRFVEYMLYKIKESLEQLVATQRPNLTDLERLSYFLEQFGAGAFSRKDYLRVFPNISVATASRDLRKGVEQGLLSKSGDGRLTTYRQT